MKKITAMILAFMMMLTCLPVMAFAEEPDQPVDDPAALEEVMDYIHSDEIISLYGLINDKINEWQETMQNVLDIVNDNIDDFQENSMEQLPVYLEQLNGYIAAADSYIREFAGREDVQAAIEKLKGALETVKNAAQAVMEKAEEYIGVSGEMIAQAQEKAQELIAQAQEKAQELIAQAQEKAQELIAQAQAAFESVKEQAQAIIAAAPQNLEAAKAKAQELIQNAKEQFENVKAQALEKLEEAKTVAAGYIAKAQEAAAQLIAEAKEKVPAAIENVKASAQKLLAEAKEKIQNAKEQFEKADKFLVTLVQTGFFDTAFNTLIDKAKNWAAENGLDENLIAKFEEQAEMLGNILKAYGNAGGMDGMKQKLNELAEQAKEAVLENARKIVEVVKDVSAYAGALRSGDTTTPFMTAQEKASDLDTLLSVLDSDDLFDALDSVEGLHEDLNQARADLAAAQETVIRNQAQSEDLKIAVAAMKSVPTLKAKAKKGKKLTITLKPKNVAGATINSYEVKVGKKVIKVKKAATKKITQKNKALKKALKKIKKGTKAQIQFRVIYKIGNETYPSQWSKVKNVKIK